MSKPTNPEPWIELRLWRQFVTVAQELHFGRAASRLHMTQPPLTQAIAQLEKLLGVRLFERTKRSVQLTESGLALLAQAQALLSQSQGLVLEARALASGESGRLRLGFVSTVGYSLLPQWVRAFRERYPSVALELMEATGDTQLELLQQGKLDAGFMLHSPGFVPLGLQSRLLASEPLILALPEAHPLAHAPVIQLAQVLAEPLILFPRRILPSVFDALFSMYHANGYTPVVAQEAIQMQTIVNLVSADLGVAWVPESVRQFQRSGVSYRVVKTGPVQPVLGCETSLVWRDSSPVLDRFLTFTAELAVGL